MVTWLRICVGAGYICGDPAAVPVHGVSFARHNVCSPYAPASVRLIRWAETSLLPFDHEL
jgi:hypothetical protein